MRNRSMVIITNEDRILMEKVFYDNRFFFTLPGGGIEEGETPEEAALRELEEECNVKGEIIRNLTRIRHSDGSTEYVYECKIIGNQIPVKGYDPEEPMDNQPIKEVCWKKIEELSEIDRAFLWSYGLLEIDQFREKVFSGEDKNA